MWPVFIVSLANGKGSSLEDAESYQKGVIEVEGNFYLEDLAIHESGGPMEAARISLWTYPRSPGLGPGCPKA